MLYTCARILAIVVHVVNSMHIHSHTYVKICRIFVHCEIFIICLEYSGTLSSDWSHQRRYGLIILEINSYKLYCCPYQIAGSKLLASCDLIDRTMPFIYCYIQTLFHSMIKTNDWLQFIEKQILCNRMNKNVDTKPDGKYFDILNDLIGYVTQWKD